jgi:tRNA threonylcarbamoyladenosine biosynthesis protein TsaE
LSGGEQGDTWWTTSPEATLALGESLGRLLIGGVTIGLVGPLGSGKTQLVKGIAVGNSIDDVRKVTSPTFTLVHEHPGTLRLYHVDVYRLSGARELEALGFEEFARPDSAVVVEWADRVRSVMPEDALWIELIPTGETSRTLTFRATGDMGAQLLDALREARR